MSGVELNPAYELMILSDSVWWLFLRILPYWVSGILAGSLVSVFLAEKIYRLIKWTAGCGNQVSNSKRVSAISARLRDACSIIAASVLGVVSPLCMFGTIPLIVAFGKSGVPQHLLASFMVSSVLLNPNIFMLTFVLGGTLAWMRLVFSVLSGVFAGVLVLVFYKDKALFSFGGFGDTGNKKKKSFFKDLVKAFRITAPYLLLGIVLSALFSRYVPPQFVARIFGTGARQGLGMLLATSLSVPLYACGGGVIPLIRAWMFAGMGVGDAMAFMLAGPATKITNVSAVKVLLPGRHFAFYLLYCFSFAVVAGLITAVLV